MIFAMSDIAPGRNGSLNQNNQSVIYILRTGSVKDATATLNAICAKDRVNPNFDRQFAPA